jgi:hypothetical protein
LAKFPLGVNILRSLGLESYVNPLGEDWKAVGSGIDRPIAKEAGENGMVGMVGKAKELSSGPKIITVIRLE